MNAAARYDNLPWYKQFWPWFLIGLPASVVVAGFITLYIANKYADDLVTDDYYKNGLAINRQLENKHRAAELGIAADIKFSGNSVTAKISGPVAAAELQLMLSHPLEADRDFSVTLVRDAPGLYSALLEHTIATRWHWILENRDAPRWRLDGSVGSGSGDDARLSRDQ